MDGKSLVQFLAQNAHLPTVVVITIRVFIVIYRAPHEPGSVLGTEW